MNTCEKLLIVCLIFFVIALMALSAHGQEAGIKLEYTLVNSCIQSVDIPSINCHGEDPTKMVCDNIVLNLKPGLKPDDCLNINIVRPGQSKAVTTAPIPASVNIVAAVKALPTSRARKVLPAIDTSFIYLVEEPK